LTEASTEHPLHRPANILSVRFGGGVAELAALYLAEGDACVRPGIAQRAYPPVMCAPHLDLPV